LNWYPTKCIDLGDNGGKKTAVTFSATHHPPGIYCISGSKTTLTISSDLNGLGGGQGYTFFALGGAGLDIGGASIKFYWPSACGARPGTRYSFSCNGVSSGYDPQTLLFATSTAFDQIDCAGNAICIAGGGSNLEGDVFAPKPDSVFPPGPSTTATGAGVFIAGNAAVAGSGFFESWLLTIQGTAGSYTGTGPTVGGTPVVTTTTTATTIFTPTTIFGTTDPGSTTPNQTIPGTTDPGTTITNSTTVGTTHGLDE
jgi:hypothetical protein